MILPTRYVSLRNVGRRNESTISCEISAFANFDPLKLVFSPVFYIFWKILVPFTKFDLIVVFEKCVCVTQFVREHDRAKNVAWMSLWCSLDGVLRIFPHTIPTVKLLAYMLQRIHIYKLGIDTDSTHTISKFWCVWGSSLNVIVYFKSHSHLLTKLMTYNVIYWCNH